MQDDRREKISRTLSRALRHRPEDLGLIPDAQGWVALADVLAALRRRPLFADLSEADLRVAAEPWAGKSRFEISGAEGSEPDARIRARYGHSFAQPVEHAAAEPPETLYHGTSPEAASAILASGMQPMRRQRVHLSADVATALRVGARHDRHPVLLVVEARAAARSGVVFATGGDGVWMSTAIPARYVRRAERQAADEAGTRIQATPQGDGRQAGQGAAASAEAAPAEPAKARGRRIERRGR